MSYGEISVKDDTLTIIDDERGIGMMLDREAAAETWPKIKSFAETGNVKKIGADIEAVRLSLANKISMSAITDRLFIFNPWVRTDEDLYLRVYISRSDDGKTFRVSDKGYSAIEWGVYRFSDLDEYSGMVIQGKRPLKRKLKLFVDHAWFAADIFAVCIDDATGEVFDEGVCIEGLRQSIEDVTSCMLHLRSKRTVGDK